MKGRLFEEWEIAFIRLTYPEFGGHIAKYINRASYVIHKKAAQLNIKVKKIIIGQKFDKLTVIELLNESKNKCRLCLCKCECGNLKKVKNRDLLRGHVKSCNCSKTPPKSIGCITGHWYRKIQNTAKQRDKKFDLSIEYLAELWKKQEGLCALTKLQLKISSGVFAKWSTASLDRIDSKKPYIEGNVQFVHRDINMMKHIYEQNYFIKFCKLVAKNFNDVKFDSLDFLEEN